VASRPSTAPRAVARRVAKLTALQVQLRVELKGVQPLIWRRILVPENVTLQKLHVTLLRAMGWLGGHVHEYEIARLRYGLPDPDWSDPELHDERRFRLKSFIDTGLRRFTYIYDLGDHWEHAVTVEDIVVPVTELPPVRCLAGENACPPEDVGSVDGYAAFLEILKDPAHEDHQQTLQWAGGAFDPAAFNLEDLNEHLAEIKA
jgi:hypothetical protein